MVQVIHRGDEATQGVTIPSATEGLSEFLSRVENRERYEKELQMRREQQLLDLMSVNTDNLIFEQYQGKASELLDGFVNNATSVYKNKKGVLSADDKMNLMRERQKVEMQVGGMRSKAQMYIQAKNALIQDGGTDLDWEESWENLDNFRKDPVNTDPPSLVPTYIDPIVAIQKKLDKQHPYTRPTSVKRQMVDGSWKEDFVSYRRGLETEEAQKAWLEKQLEDRDIRRTVMSKKYYNGDTNAFISEGEPLVKPVYTTDLSNVSGYSTMVLGGGGGTVGWSNTTDPQLGEIINATGNVPPFNLNVNGELTTVKLRVVGEKGIKLDYPETIPDTSFKGLDFSQSRNPYREAEARYAKPIQGEDGLWYPSKTVTSTIVVGKDDEELNKYYSDIEKAIRAGKNTNSEDYLKSWNKFKADVEQKKKAVPSQPKKEEKKKGVQGSFFN